MKPSIPLVTGADSSGVRFIYKHVARNGAAGDKVAIATKFGFDIERGRAAVQPAMAVQTEYSSIEKEMSKRTVCCKLVSGWGSASYHGARSA